MTEREAYIVLNMTPGIGGMTARAGIEVFGSAIEFLHAGVDEICNLKGVSRKRAEAFCESFQTLDPATEIARAEASSVQIITPVDYNWPAKLNSIPSPPLALYITGDFAALNLPCIAIVGTRSPTMYGSEQARTFAHRLAKSGHCIVSGLARGVDTEAAQSALFAGGRTIAVIGSALDRLYPPENKQLASVIAARGGAVISEYPLGRSANRHTFPMRNRIISGLSDGVICIEAGVASGTMNTADHALKQGRRVMFVPGRASEPVAQGCQKLIANGARLVESPEDVLNELDSLSRCGTCSDEKAPRMGESALACGAAKASA